MRYDTPIYFQKVTEGQYDTSTGDYGDDVIVETEVMASVMDTQTEAMKLIYGTIMQGSRTIQIQNHYSDAFDQIRIGKRIYRVDRSRNLKTKQTFIVSEVQ